jgi:hypothetical protein
MTSVVAEGASDFLDQDMRRLVLARQGDEGDLTYLRVRGHLLSQRRLVAQPRHNEVGAERLHHLDGFLDRVSWRDRKSEPRQDSHAARTGVGIVVRD